MNDDIQLIITALENYTGLPWNYLKTTHQGIEKLLEQSVNIISREDLIEISKTICDRCTMGDKLCDAIMNLLSAQLNTSNTLNVLDCISRQTAIDAMCGLMYHWFGGDPKDEIREIKRELERLPPAQPEIITCTECKYYDTDTEQCNNDKGLRFIDFSNPERMWCPWAERREG